MKTGMLFETFDNELFPSAGAETPPERSVVMAARSEVAKAVIDDDFLADCILLELRRLQAHIHGNGLVPFFTIPRTGVRFAFGYWPPGGTPGPHEHSDWTITAVCRNELDVLTFDRDESYRCRQLIPKNRFHADAGRVGFIYEPCIHEPKNLSQEWSLTLHVRSPRDGETIGDFQACFPSLALTKQMDSDQQHPYLSVITARQRHRFTTLLMRTVSQMKISRVPEILNRCAEIGSSPTRRTIQEILGTQQDPSFKLRHRLFKTNSAVRLGHRLEGDMVALDIETPNGREEEFAIPVEFTKAMAFIAEEEAFEVQRIPGNLTDDEKLALADVLEQTGIFTRFNQ